MDHVFVLYDRASSSVWYPADETLNAVAGKRQGAAIAFLDKPAPLPLSEWLTAHPGTTVLLPTERDFKLIHRPYLGVHLEDGEGAVVIESVVEGSPAEAAGFLAGDVLRKVDGRSVGHRRELREIMIDLERGQTVKVLVDRDGEKLELRPTLGAP